jgi:hypothetical protein
MHGLSTRPADHQQFKGFAPRSKLRRTCTTSKTDSEEFDKES